MNTTNIANSKKLSLKIITVLNVIIWFNILYFIASIVLLVWASFLPEQAFFAEKGVGHWSLGVNTKGNVSTNGNISFSSLVPFAILQPSFPSMFELEAKAAYITYFSTHTLTSMPAFLYGAIQIKKILTSITDDDTPFSHKNVQRFKHLAYVVIGYALFSKVIISIAIGIFVTNIFSITLTTISLSGIVGGFLLLIVAQIFQYGAYLQNEHDTTL
ncbi:DUF2975 domain-containing protein [Aquibacillus rhizosphaerae]|uniref:DUF2975 domain-containing protein n=1 Tax=Aquibacillus rhizosphaerae TaxID=3051431 RepID=A0ABT7L9N0_9BACI|nr:DUF2975 domain-containing protein [Aquibacillus sp. LR5S19]MDL4842089.1 DUF2975 domain-containing protein [Aquibacillus sp. LR5S19]